MIEQADRATSTTGATAAKPRVVFGLAQVLGHVSYAQVIRRFVGEADVLDPTFVDVHFYKTGGLVERAPLPNFFRGALRARLEVRDAMGGRMPDAFFFNTETPSLLCHDYVRSTPTLIAMDATPAQYDTMAHAYRDDADRPGLVHKLKHASNRRLFAAASRCVAYSHWVRQSLQDDYGVDPAKIAVIPPGVDIDRWRPAPRVPSDRVKIVFVGGDFERKGGDMLLDWFRTAPEAKNCELHLVTREPIAPSKGVHVHANMTNNSDEIISLVRRADIFALPTTADCFPIACIEAMAAGLPVVATTVGGIADIVTPGRTGFTLPPGDRAELASVLRLLVADPELRARMGANGRAKAQAEFDARRNVGRLIAEIEASIAERGDRKAKA